MKITDIKSRFASRECYEVYSYCMFQPSFDKFIARAEKLTADRCVHILGCIEDDRICGIIAVRDDGGSAEICGIAVDCANRKRGIGSALVHHAAELLKAEELYAETDDDAVGFYEKCGFTVKSEVRTFGDCECVRYTCRMKCGPDK